VATPAEEVDRYDDNAKALRAQSMMTRRSHRSATRVGQRKLSARTIEPGKRTSPAWAGRILQQPLHENHQGKVLAAKVMKT